MSCTCRKGSAGGKWEKVWHHCWCFQYTERNLLRRMVTHAQVSTSPHIIQTTAMQKFQLPHQSSQIQWCTGLPQHSFTPSNHSQLFQDHRNVWRKTVLNLLPQGRVTRKAHKVTVYIIKAEGNSTRIVSKVLQTEWYAFVAEVGAQHGNPSRLA